MNVKKTISYAINMILCFVLMIDIVQAAVDDDVITSPIDLGFEITSYATSVEPVENEFGLEYSLLSSSDQSYVYFHRNINQDFSGYNGVYFDIKNPSFEKLLVTLTLSPGVGNISSIPPSNNVGQINYIEEEDFFDDFWDQDDRDGDGHYDKEVEDKDDDQDDIPLGVNIIANSNYFITKPTQNYFITNSTKGSQIEIPSGFDGRIYIPFFSMGLGGEESNILLNNISSFGFTIVATNGLSQNFQLRSFGKYNYSNNSLLEEAKYAKIVGADKVSIPTVGINTTKQELDGLDENAIFYYEIVTSDNFITIMDLEEHVIGIYPRALEGAFNVRVWVNEFVCLQKTITLEKTLEGISSVSSENVTRDTGYISSLAYMSFFINFYRYYFLIIPILFALVVVLILTVNKSNDNDGQNTNKNKNKNKSSKKKKKKDKE